MPSSPSTIVYACDANYIPIAEPIYTPAASARLLACVPARYVSPLTNTAQAMRAILLASATATTLAGRRPNKATTQGYLSGRVRALLMTARAPTMSRRAAGAWAGRRHCHLDPAHL